MSRQRIALIGIGAMGRLHLNHFIKGGAEVVGMADPNQKGRQEVTEKTGLDCFFDDHNEMLAKVKPDGVCISAPNFLHAPLACDAMRAGAKVLLEKPMGATLADCQQILDVEKETGQWVMMGFCRRYLPETQMLKEMVEAGKFGEIYHCRLEYYRRRGIPGWGSWFTDKKKSGGGALVDLGPHMLDQLMYVMGYPELAEVAGAAYQKFGHDFENYKYLEMWGSPPDPKAVCDVDDFATGIVRMKNGATVSLTITWAANTKLGDSIALDLFGTKAGVSISNGEIKVYAEDGSYLVDQTPHLPKCNYLQLQADAFLKCLAHGSPPPATSTEGYAIQAIIDAIYRSSDAGHAVQVSL